MMMKTGGILFLFFFLSQNVELDEGRSATSVVVVTVAACFRWFDDDVTEDESLCLFGVELS